MTDNNTDTYIETYTGKHFDFLTPQLDMIDMEDIAHSLSMQCRYTGHCNEFYSIAEHSLFVSDMCSPENKLWGLLHDASEAYLTDVASPVKPFLQNYKLMERKLMNKICEKYNIELVMPDEVHYYDMVALKAEAYQMTQSKGLDWAIANNQTIELKTNVDFDYYTPKQAKLQFLDVFHSLMG